MEEQDQWKIILAMLGPDLEDIDRLLSGASVPVSDRASDAFDLIKANRIEVPDEDAFLVSDLHEKFRVVIEEWFRRRYGAAVDGSSENVFPSLAVVHNTPFLLGVPAHFRTPLDENDLMWLAFPASIQKEESVLDWIENQSVLGGLDDASRADLDVEVSKTAQLIRSIGFDLLHIEKNEPVEIANLAVATRADLQEAARHICGQSDAGLRSAGWCVSQATEKALKIFIRRAGNTPPFSHDLEELSSRAESNGASGIPRENIERIPSSREATDLRYGGNLSIDAAPEAYFSALVVVQHVLFDSAPESALCTRNLKIQIRRRPWFDFDTEEFSRMLSRDREGDTS